MKHRSCLLLALCASMLPPCGVSAVGIPACVISQVAGLVIASRSHDSRVLRIGKLRSTGRHVMFGISLG